jgi:hypothetical protein
MRVAQNLVGSRANLEHLKTGDAAVAENNQVHVVRFRPVNDLFRWMTHHDGSLNFHVRFLGALLYVFEAFLEVLPRVIEHRFHLNASCRLWRARDSEYEKFGVATMRYVQCHTHGVLGIFRAIVSHEDFAKD